jgi:hypothetical protein
MTKKWSTDYETYREIIGDLLKPIHSDGLDVDTLKRLYESKLVYLENLRVKCFRDLNSKVGFFSKDDYSLIVQAAADTKKHMRAVLLSSISQRLSRIKKLA